MQDGKRILLVDDDLDFLDQMKLRLEDDGFKVSTAQSEEEALDTFDGSAFDLAIVDLMLEHMDSGFVLSHEFKQKKPALPVIIVTAVTRETGRQFALDNAETRSWIKADSIVQKDIRYEQLSKEVHRLLGA